MKIIKRFKFSGLFFIIVFFAACAKVDKVIPKVSVSSTEVPFAVNGGESEITISSNTDWKIVSSDVPNKLQLSQTSGIEGSTKVKITASANSQFSTRSAMLFISTTIGAPYKISVTQFSRSGMYPGYNSSPLPADATGMSSNAVQLATKFKLGWNIGNTFRNYRW